MPTPDELVVHLREAGAKCVYLSRERAFREGTVPITVTYEFSREETEDDTGSEMVHEMLTSVFDAFGDQIWFHDRKWFLDWSVEPAFTEPELDLIPLYDRRVERKHGDGFNLWNLRFVYEAYRE
ncbi:hypothetical protein [Haloferax mediterranei]|uniref:hypothetical protein n=1 Tax=Haloferax mediterranei TaxID=2252 RepID=UPI001E33EC8A|nr:hypothetical protein [Haloferax mediterranei]MDX5990229.1 hypothetical protein [Haloferax mediterranei ATCC 33500]